MFRMHIKYNGNVQGVGFRWNVFELSKSYSVTGYVKNLASGEVELLVEGKKSEVFDFVNTLEKKLEDFWYSKKIEIKPEGSHFDRFEIKYI